MCDDVVFDDGFRYQLTMFAVFILIELYRLLDIPIAYVIDTDKIIAAFFRISYCLLDLIC